jgi:hypothetical protein
MNEPEKPGTIYMRGWRARNRAHTDAYQREYRRSRRARVVAHYGGACACCGETTPEFLALDHIEGGGEQHRAQVGQGSNMVEWLIKSGLPEGFRVLCHNCNQAIGYYGACPHEQALRLVAGDE